MPAAQRDAIVGMIAEEVRIDRARLHDHATLASLDIASLDMMTVLFAIEDRYGVEIQPEEVAGAETLGRFVDIIQDKVAAA